jgi:hypothetical protein
MSDFLSGTVESSTEEPQLTPTEFQALFRMSNGNVLPQAKKFFGAWRYQLICSVCRRSREIEPGELLTVNVATPSSPVYVWCAGHKHLKATEALQASTDMPLPIIEPRIVTRKFKGE